MTRINSRGVESAPAWISHLWQHLRPSHVAVLFSFLQLLRYTGSVLGGKTILRADSAVYLFGGWLTAHGQPVYLYLWDVKPPGIYLLATSLSIIAGGDRLSMYYGSLILGATAILTIVWAASTIVKLMTDSDSCALLAGLVAASYAPMYTLLVSGWTVKHFAATFGLLAVLFWIRDHPLIAGALAAGAAGFWQFAIGFALVLGVVTAHQDLVRDDWGTTNRFLAGGAATAALFVAPFVIMGAGEQLFIQTVVVPFTMGGSEQTVVAIKSAMLRFEFTVVLFGIGIVATIGIAVQLAMENHQTAPLEAVALGLCLWWLLAPVALGQTGAPDLIPVLPTLAIGVGLTLARVDASVRYFVAVIVVIILLLQLAAGGPTWGMSELGASFLGGNVPEGCHIRLSVPEQSWIQQTATTRADARCSGLDVLWRR